ncbi:MAG: methionyl-tRNA formyltransferase [Candidatus Edwardsbacteria bacterium]|nr:methionyl-tRNA formyltransferase [Candidatus Edwardsbacteria bacterium]MBU1577309.1 methionyl-tRNA formyltransferase [Candidatus Edwardsbacteria bacterium]MBU2464282.1 methionyl-tRNA formyltransferase [Candidatus Edwardsbacteria bacterium]MBU2594910.1 methionyl-tRNA formyltransferase [Candidatus Edwardsbacteria bacterium]
MRIVFMGTPGFAVPTLEAINQKGHDILAVFTQPDRPSGRGRSIAFSPVKQKAMELGISIQQPDTLKQNQTIQAVSNLEPEIVVVVAYGLKLPNDILDIPKYGAVNLHPSLLPKYRGAAPINHALLNGEKTTGITSVLMNSRMDAGDIILQEEVPITDEENAGELEGRLAKLGADLIIRSLDVLKAGDSEFKKQDESMVTLASKLSSQDGHITWSRSTDEVQNQIRGLTPKPGAFAMFKGKRLEILNILMNYELQIKNHEYLPGQVVAVDKDKGPVIKTLDGVVILTEVKPQGKKAMGGDEFLRGYKPAVGDKLL